MTTTTPILTLAEVSSALQNKAVPRVLPFMENGIIRYHVQIGERLYGSKDTPRVFISITGVHKFLSTEEFPSYIMEFNEDVKQYFSHVRWRKHILSERFKKKGSLQKFSADNNFVYNKVRMVLRNRTVDKDIRIAIAVATGHDLTDLWPEYKDE